MTAKFVWVNYLFILFNVFVEISGYFTFDRAGFLSLAYIKCYLGGKQKMQEERCRVFMVMKVLSTKTYRVIHDDNTKNVDISG
jgi:hypothetical protein